jgi:DNA-binding transcriptional MocR family regulator
LVIIEGDSWSSVTGQEVTPISALAPERTIYIEPFSNDFMPGLGACLVHVSAPLAQRFLATRHALLLSTPRLISEVVTHWIVSGVAQALIAAVTRTCARRVALARRVAPRLVQRGSECTPFLWTAVGARWRADAFVHEAETRGVVVLPAGRFALTRSSAPECVRIALCSARSDSELELGLAELDALLR